MESAKNLSSDIIMLICQKDSISDNKKRESNTVCALIQYMENNYWDNITNETIAEAFHYSSAYISQVFKKHTRQDSCGISA